MSGNLTMVETAMLIFPLAAMLTSFLSDYNETVPEKKKIISTQPLQSYH